MRLPDILKLDVHHVVDRIIHEDVGTAVDYQAELAHHDHRGKGHNFSRQIFQIHKLYKYQPYSISPP